MKECSSETAAAKVTAELMDWFIDSGITKITKIKLMDVQVKAKNLTKYYSYHSIPMKY